MSERRELAEVRDDVSLFDRVVCGVDHTDAGLTAAKLAARVCSPRGSLLLVSVNDPTNAVHAGWAAPIALEELHRTAETALEEGQAAAELEHASEGRLVSGRPLDALQAALHRKGATLVVIGRHERVRAVGIAVGSVATHLLHEAPCPVLVAPPEVDLDRWPSSIVVGVDGSDSSLAALEVGRVLASRFGADLRALMATRGGEVEVERARAAAVDLEESQTGAVDALAVASERADLVIVGSRGLRGLRALGSVGERVAHEAASPVLVVRSHESRELGR